jgi:hypothetical protein
VSPADLAATVADDDHCREAEAAPPFHDGCATANLDDLLDDVAAPFALTAPTAAIAFAAAASSLLSFFAAATAALLCRRHVLRAPGELAAPLATRGE